eukprot:scaffold67092_cov39-Tisochrysis_lutea.AAC.3
MTSEFALVSTRITPFRASASSSFTSTSSGKRAWTFRSNLTASLKLASPRLRISPAARLRSASSALEATTAARHGRGKAARAVAAQRSGVKAWPSR